MGSEHTDDAADAPQRAAQESGAVSCGVCGTLAPDGAPPTWSMQSSERGVRMICAECTRANIRSIEGKLDEAWW